MTRESESGPVQLCLWPLIPYYKPAPPQPLVGKCLRRRPARAWNHKNCGRDNRTVAVWCGCAECLNMLHPVNRLGW